MYPCPRRAIKCRAEQKFCCLSAALRRVEMVFDHHGLLPDVAGLGPNQSRECARRSADGTTEDDAFWLGRVAVGGFHCRNRLRNP